MSEELGIDFAELEELMQDELNPTEFEEIDPFDISDMLDEQRPLVLPNLEPIVEKKSYDPARITSLVPEILDARIANAGFYGDPIGIAPPEDLEELEESPDKVAKMNEARSEKKTNRKESYYKYREMGLTQQDAADMTAISLGTAKRYDKERK